MNESEQGSKGQSRPFIGVQFDCCNVYVRVYRHHSGTHYFGRCPKCGRTVRLEVGEGGSSSRFYRAR